MVPVKPSVEGDPADGFVLGTVTANPPMVEVVGPKTALEALTEAITESVSVAGAAGPVTETVTVGVFDPSIRLKTPQSARVTVNVTAAPVEWAVGAVQVQVRNSAQAVLMPSQVTVHVRGPRETMRSGAEEFEASVNADGLRPGQYELPVRVVPPPRVGVVRVVPAEVRVRIR
jgi:YbbR domain-containing protein